MQKNKGFTLIELSIVLVVGGLLIVSIIIGRELVRQSQIQNIIVEVNNFRAVVDAFREQYRDLPGDMSDAYKQWGDNCDVTDTKCNGNGDGKIETNPLDYDDSEDLRGWQHLVLAKSISGTFTGEDAGSVNMHIGTNIPGSKVSNGGYNFLYGNVGSKTGNFISFGAEDGGLVLGKVLSVEEARNIDQKSDDGLASYGDVMAEDGSDAGPNSCVSGVPKSYTTDNNDAVVCSMRFLLN